MARLVSASRLLAALRGPRLRRVSALAPASARRRVNLVMSTWVDRSALDVLVEDWARPLVPAPAPAAAQTVADIRRRGVVSSFRRGSSDAFDTEPATGGPRCLLVSSSLDVGGMDEMVAFLARRLRSEGVQTAVLHTCTAPSAEGARGRLGRMLSAAGIEVVVLSEAAGRRWMRAWAPEVISAHGAPGWVLDEARSMAAPYVEVLHGMHSLFDVDWAAEAERNHDVAAIVAVSELVRRQYLDGAPDFPEERIITIPNGVDDERRAPVDRSAARAALGLDDEFLFVSLARHCVQKNTFALVSAFDEVAAEHSDAHLLVAGHPEDSLYCTQVRMLRDGLATRERIHLRDHAPDPGLVLSAADGFVLDSFFEGWALASMEALHAGVPVVASDVGGAREQVGKDGERGYVVRNPLGDPLNVSWKTMRSVCYERQANRAELISAMSALMLDRVEWATKRDELATESAERFAPGHCARSHAVLLHSLAAAGAAASPAR